MSKPSEKTKTRDKVNASVYRAKAAVERAKRETVSGSIIDVCLDLVHEELTKIFDAVN